MKFCVVDCLKSLDLNSFLHIIKIIKQCGENTMFLWKGDFSTVRAICVSELSSFCGLFLANTDMQLAVLI